MAQKKVQQAPDASLSANFSELFNKVFGPSDEPNNAEQMQEAIASLSTSEAIALRAYIGLREAQFHEINATLSASIASRDISQFPSESALFSVTDEETNEVVGGVLVETKVTTVRSTKDKRTAEKVKEALQANGLLGTYTKQSIELQNDTLFEANANGVLPQSVSSLLTETKKSERVSSYVPVKTLKGAE